MVRNLETVSISASYPIIHHRPGYSGGGYAGMSCPTFFQRVKRLLYFRLLKIHIKIRLTLTVSSANTYWNLSLFYNCL